MNDAYSIKISSEHAYCAEPDDARTCLVAQAVQELFPDSVIEVDYSPYFAETRRDVRIEVYPMLEDVYHVFTLTSGQDIPFATDTGENPINYVGRTLTIRFERSICLRTKETISSPV